MKILARTLIAGALLSATASAWAHPVISGHTRIESTHSRAPQPHLRTASAHR